MRLYISGPVREVENYEERFLDAERVLENKGHIVFNPVKICASMPDDMVYEEYMSVDLKILSLCDGVVLLPGWQSSIGANREYGFALGADLEIFSSPDQVPSVSLRAAMLYMTDVREQNHDVTTCASAKPADVRDDSEKTSVADGCEEEQETNTQKGDVVELKKKKQKKGKNDYPEKRSKPLDYGKLKALHDAGWSANKIADEMGCAPGTVNTALWKMRKTEKAGEGEAKPADGEES